MAKNPAGKPGRRPTRKPFKYVRVKEPAASLAEQAAKTRLGKLSQWVTEAVIEKLEREGRWPPKPAESHPPHGG